MKSEFSLSEIEAKALDNQFLSVEEGVFLYKRAQLGELMLIADAIRRKKTAPAIVSWQIDRNVNITNVCVSFCKFCNFCRKRSDEDAYITGMAEYDEKIAGLFKYGGNQLLLQGGLHPDLGLDFYKELFSSLKTRYPELKLHALGPPEIAFIADRERMATKDVLVELIRSGLDSLPGAGAEILVDRVRNFVSPAKCDSDTWLSIMHEAHELGLTTSATMMFGHIETIEERMIHLVRIRETQELKPLKAKGFMAFIAWPFMDEGTKLATKYNVYNKVGHDEYLRMIAISRIMLPNIQNIQASWLTAGKELAQLALFGGANDLGSIMIEENVVSAAGVKWSMDRSGMEELIHSAGFKAQLRDQDYNFRPI